jgi:hypothetical protein
VWQASSPALRMSASVAHAETGGEVWDPCGFLQIYKQNSLGINPHPQVSGAAFENVFTARHCACAHVQQAPKSSQESGKQAGDSGSGVARWWSSGLEVWSLARCAGSRAAEQRLSSTGGCAAWRTRALRYYGMTQRSDARRIRLVRA